MKNKPRVRISKKTRERAFCEQWVAMLWHAMTASGKGYKMNRLGNTGVGSDRRKDKIEAATAGVSQRARRYRERYRVSTTPAKWA